MPALALLEAPVDWASTRLVAGVMLCIYFAVAAVQFGRESRFLASVEMPARLWFIVQDLLIQVAVLICLLPVTLAPAPSKPALIASVTGMGLLWLAGIWTMISRRVYTYRLLLGAHGETDRLVVELLKKQRERDGQAEHEDG